MNNAVEFTNVVRCFGSGKEQTVAVDGLTFCVPKGSAFGLLGANGAGKTTSIRMMVSHLNPHQGEIRVLEHDPAKHDESIRRRIAYISENMQLPNWMTIESGSEMMARLYPDWNRKIVEHLTKRFRLDTKKRYDECSKGQRRAICIILGLAQNAELLILDEPASGLDTLARRDFLLEILNVVCDENRTVLFSSHILGDIERIVDRVAILTRGKLVIEGELDTLKESVRKITLPGKVQQNVFQTIRTEHTEMQTMLVVTDFTEEKMKQLCQTAMIGDLSQVEVCGLNLEDLFVETVLV